MGLFLETSMKRIDYRLLWEKAHRCCLLPGVEIHHINGNRSDNRLENLKPVTLEEHLEIHLSQNDYYACALIISRMNADKTNISNLMSRHQLKLIEENKHNFQRMSRKRRTEISKKVGEYTKEMGLGIHSINKDKVLHKKLSSMGGTIARDNKKGFHDPSKNGYNVVRGTKWWTNIKTKERIRAKQQPGPEWVRGMK